MNYRKDARLPVQLQRAMAAEAEAAREARAKVNYLCRPHIYTTLNILIAYFEYISNRPYTHT